MRICPSYSWPPEIAFSKIVGFEVTPSRTNFVLVRPPPPGALAIHRELGARRILVRHFPVPGLEDRLRISVGTPHELDRLVTAIEEVLRTTSR